MDKTLANTTDTIIVSEAKTLKNGRIRKAVFANWNGGALVKENGRIVARTAYGKIANLKGAKLAIEHAEMVGKFNDLGKARLAFESTEIAAGKRELTRLFIDPINGKTIIETATADKSVKVAKKLKEKGFSEDQISQILESFKA